MTNILKLSPRRHRGAEVLEQPKNDTLFLDFFNLLFSPCLRASVVNPLLPYPL